MIEPYVTHAVVYCDGTPIYFVLKTTQTVTKEGSEFSFSLLYKRPLTFLSINNLLPLIPFTHPSRLCSNLFPPQLFHKQPYFIP
jgi:hypothetical protein